MKKVLLVMMVVVGAMAHGRDFEYNGRRDVERHIQRIDESKVDMLGRATCGEWDIEHNLNFERYSRFHSELETQERGHQDR